MCFNKIILCFFTIDIRGKYTVIKTRASAYILSKADLRKGRLKMDIPETQRPRALGEYIAKNGATVREAARSFGISKSTVHKDVTEKLRLQDRPLFEQVRAVLDKNKAERHMRGGEATKQKYIRESALSAKKR